MAKIGLRTRTDAPFDLVLSLSRATFPKPTILTFHTFVLMSVIPDEIVSIAFQYYGCG